MEKPRIKVVLNLWTFLSIMIGLLVFFRLFDVLICKRNWVVKRLRRLVSSSDVTKICVSNRGGSSPLCVRDQMEPSCTRFLCSRHSHLFFLNRFINFYTISNFHRIVFLYLWQIRRLCFPHSKGHVWKMSDDGPEFSYWPPSRPLTSFERTPCPDFLSSPTVFSFLFNDFCQKTMCSLVIRWLLPVVRDTRVYF